MFMFISEMDFPWYGAFGDGYRSSLEAAGIRDPKSIELQAEAFPLVLWNVFSSGRCAVPFLPCCDILRCWYCWM
jgi:hypothetical protein